MTLASVFEIYNLQLLRWNYAALCIIIRKMAPRHTIATLSVYLGLRV